MSEPKKSKGFLKGGKVFPARVTASIKKGDTVTNVGSWSNVVTNGGMNAVFDGTDLYHMTSYISIGNGSIDTEIDSGAITASQSADSVSSSAEVFLSDMVGHTIKWDTGEEAMITAYTSTQSVTVTPSQTVASGQFTIHCTGLTDLDHYVAQVTPSTGYVAYDTGIIRQVTTARFTGLSADTYTELAYGPNTTLRFGILNLTGGITIDEGDEILIKLTREFALDETIKSAVLKAVDSYGVETTVANVSTQIAGILQTDGTGGIGKCYFGRGEYNTSEYSLYASQYYVATVNPSLPGTIVRGSWNVSKTNVFNASKSLSTYVSNSFERTATWILPTSATGTFYGLSINSASYVGGTAKHTEYAFVFDTPYVKNNQHNFKIQMTFSLPRVLVN